MLRRAPHQKWILRRPVRPPARAPSEASGTSLAPTPRKSEGRDPRPPAPPSAASDSGSGRAACATAALEREQAAVRLAQLRARDAAGGPASEEETASQRIGELGGSTRADSRFYGVDFPLPKGESSNSLRGNLNCMENVGLAPWKLWRLGTRGRRYIEESSSSLRNADGFLRYQAYAYAIWSSIIGYTSQTGVYVADARIQRGGASEADPEEEPELPGAGPLAAGGRERDLWSIENGVVGKRVGICEAPPGRNLECLSYLRCTT